MTISIWRYSHLALAVSSFLLLLLASITGILLAFKPLTEKTQPYRPAEFNRITLAQSLPVIRKKYPGVSELSVDANQFVRIKGSGDDGKQLLAYVDPLTGKILGTPTPESEFFEWVTALHRSLFIHETGRFFIGLTAFLLLLITVSGTILVIRRQRGWKRFFAKINRDNFAQYYHVVLGRLSLVPIFVIALSGTYLSLSRFGLVDLSQISPKIDFDAIRSAPLKEPADFDIFEKTKISQVQTIEFPFSEDPGDYYTLKLDDREIAVNQINGDILSEVRYPSAVVLTNLSLDLHTGRTSFLWAIVLAAATGNILFFIYSGFAITFKRRQNRIKNKYAAKDSEFIILVGSENGSTFHFANAIHRELIAAGKTAFLAELNNYNVFPKATHFIVMTATYGLGDAPTNAVNFESMIQKHEQLQPVRFCVVGFGSNGYPDFCKFAFEVDNLFSKQEWAIPMLEIHTVNDKSPEEFSNWAASWSQLAGISLTISPDLLTARKQKTDNFEVVSKTALSAPDGAFLINLRPKRRLKFTSGDLLAIHPANDHRERLYSIGRIGKDIQLSVKLHPTGLGSGFLYQLEAGIVIDARIVNNSHFHFPENAHSVIMISNGTGIAPFLGMIDERPINSECHLYCGFRDAASFALYQAAIEKNKVDKKLGSLHVAYSREGEKQYVKDLLERDAAFLADTLGKQGVIMLCGSLAMQKNVVGMLEHICQTHLGKSVSHYQSHNQVLMDCY
jgi:sulfite reductase (NADPH) flavoprotein alpha-component